MCRAEEKPKMRDLINEWKGACVCVYGCGQWGLQMYLLLRENGLKTDFFSDRDGSKKGYVVDGVSCITYDELLSREKGNIVLIVAIAHGERIADDFRRLGFRKVLYFEDVKNQIYSGMPEKQTDESLMQTEHWRKLKREIEKMVLAGDIPVEEKRDRVLRLVEEGGGGTQ